MDADSTSWELLSRRGALAGSWKGALPGAVLLLALPFAAHGAELQGRFWGTGISGAPGSATLHVQCGDFESSAPLSGNGTYSIRDLPSAGCHLKVNVSGRWSEPIPFKSGGSVVQFNGEIRVAGSRVMVLRR